MFPNQQARDSWGSVAGYYGNYGMTAGGSSWYNRAAGAAVGQAGWMSGSWAAAAGQTGVYDETTSAMMSNIERESSDSFSSPGSSRQKLGINSNIYSLYQSKQTRDGSSSSSSYMSPPSLRSSSDAQETDPLAFTDQRQFSSPCAENSDKIINNDEDQKNVEPDSSTDAAQDNTDTDDHHDERMQRLLAEHAKILGVKTEEDKTRYRTAQEELTELMKLTNEKLFKSSAGVKSQVETSVDTDHCSSPPRPSFMISSNTGVRRRGRKPKHYSEILYELGQRGISITKTKQEQAGVSSGAPVNSGHEMVVSDSGSVSHKTSGQQLQCPHCNKILTTSVGLMYHIRLHTGEKPYTCEICSKSFATSSHYHYHIRSHSGEKPYRRFRCDFCGKMYTASGSLRLHLKSHLSRLAVNAFSSVNLQSFNNSMNLPSLVQDPLALDSNESQFGIKQEVFEAEEVKVKDHSESIASSDNTSSDH